MLDCVAFLLVRDGRVLVERRRDDKRVAPGVLAVPGGHLDGGEPAEDGVRRELAEELGLRVLTLRYCCTGVHAAEEIRRLQYYLVDDWTGELAVHEAESVEWLPLSDVDRPDLAVDRDAVAALIAMLSAGESAS